MKIFIIALLVLLAACKKTDKSAIDNCDPRCGFGELNSSGYPACVQRIIDNGSTEYREIKRYIYNNRIVYLFMAKCCDRYDELFDCNCVKVCAPSGGIAGGGDNTCPNFFREATLSGVVWAE